MGNSYLGPKPLLNVKKYGGDTGGEYLAEVCTQQGVCYKFGKTEEEALRELHAHLYMRVAGG